MVEPAELLFPSCFVFFESPDSQIEPDTGEIFQHQFYQTIGGRT